MKARYEDKMVGGRRVKLRPSRPPEDKSADVRHAFEPWPDSSECVHCGRAADHPTHKQWSAP